MGNIPPLIGDEFLESQNALYLCLVLGLYGSELGLHFKIRYMSNVVGNMEIQVVKTVSFNIYIYIYSNLSFGLHHQSLFHSATLHVLDLNFQTNLGGIFFGRMWAIDSNTIDFRRTHQSGGVLKPNLFLKISRMVRCGLPFQKDEWSSEALFRVLRLFFWEKTLKTGIRWNG